MISEMIGIIGLVIGMMAVSGKFAEQPAKRLGLLGLTLLLVAAFLWPAPPLFIALTAVLLCAVGFNLFGLAGVSEGLIMAFVTFVVSQKLYALGALSTPLSHIGLAAMVVLAASYVVESWLGIGAGSVILLYFSSASYVDGVTPARLWAVAGFALAIIAFRRLYVERETDKLLTFTYRLPEWLGPTIRETRNLFYLQTDGTLRLEDLMRLANEMARLNGVVHKTGGPFGALVVDMQTGRIVGWGINQVQAWNCAVFHGEAVGTMFASRELGTWNLGQGEYALITSSEPCVMCGGITFWAAIKLWVSGATTADVEQWTPFGEGHKHPELDNLLERDGRLLVNGVLREECCEVLRAWTASGAQAYQHSHSE